MPVCVPITELRNTNKFAKLVKNTKQPITVTKNGYAEFVVIDAKHFDKFANESAELDLKKIIARMENDKKSKNYSDAYEHLKSIEEKYGI